MDLLTLIERVTSKGTAVDHELLRNYKSGKSFYGEVTDPRERADKAEAQVRSIAITLIHELRLGGVRGLNQDHGWQSFVECAVGDGTRRVLESAVREFGIDLDAQEES